jgi:colanic acid biosynthesis glycosyl transferase WcaI
MGNRVEFWSSTEYASFLPALMRALGERGWDAGTRFVIKEDEYRGATGRVARLALRAGAYGIYPLRLAAAMRSRLRPDVAVVCTNTFFAPWVAERVASRRGTPVVHWVYDLFPDVLVLAGTMKEGSMGEKLLRRLVRDTFDRAAANVFLGERLRAHAESRFGPIPRSTVIAVGCDSSPFRLAPPKDRPPGLPLRMLYCGNMGRMHDVETIVGVLRQGLPEGVEIEFRGNGAGFRILESTVKALNLGTRVKMGGSLAEGEWVRAMLGAEVALVTMRKGAEGLVVPSKAYSAMASGQAVLAICPGASDLADSVRANDCGWVVEPGDGAGLGRTIVEIIQNPEALLRRRLNAWRAGRDLYDQRALAALWARVLDGARVPMP